MYIAQNTNVKYVYMQTLLTKLQLSLGIETVYLYNPDFSIVSHENIGTLMTILPFYVFWTKTLSFTTLLLLDSSPAIVEIYVDCQLLGMMELDGPV